MTWNSEAQYVLHSEGNEREVHLEEKDSGFTLDWAVETVTAAPVL